MAPPILAGRYGSVVLLDQFRTRSLKNQIKILTMGHKCSLLALTQTGGPAIASAVPARDTGLEEAEILDLERYLDATKSNLLFAVKRLSQPNESLVTSFFQKTRNAKNTEVDSLDGQVAPSGLALVVSTHFKIC